MLDESGGSILLLGHTHVPFSQEFESKLIANPGSVGQPRDGDPRASYAILDLSARTRFHIRRASYDVDAAASKITAKGLPKMLADRLHLGF
jgi:predicted phosphodiesterase